MVIIFGWGHQKEQNLGPVSKRTCPRCSNEDFWELRKISNYFSLFFIPVFPYRTEHLLVCPICRAAIEVPREQLEELKKQAQGNLEQIRRQTS